MRTRLTLPPSLSNSSPLSLSNSSLSLEANLYQIERDQRKEKLRRPMEPYLTEDGQGFCSWRRYQVLETTPRASDEQTLKKSIESVVFGKKYKLFTDDDKSSLDKHFSSIAVDEQLPEIEARFSDKDLLIRIHCEKKKGVVEKTIAEIEKFQLLNHQ